MREWTADITPVYDPDKSWEENARLGPQFSGPWPERVWLDEEEWLNFLGYPVASPIGVAAGPLLNAQWIDYASKVGFDILTYKTIRSRAHPAHPAPNVIYVDVPDALDPHSLPPFLQQSAESPSSLNQLAITNSFGNPSKSQEFLSQDIAKAKAYLHKGQVLVVSCVGTESAERSLQEDFAFTAALAKEAGADVIEINFSCPNVSSQDGSLFLDSEAVYSVASQVVQAVSPLSVSVKMGLFPSLTQQKAALTAVARAGAHAVCGINTIPMKVLNTEGQPALGPARAQCGICGNPIRQAALSWVRSARQLIEEEKLDLTLIGVGGIMQAFHFTEFLEAGADFATCATAMMWDAYLVARYHERRVLCH